MRSTGRRGRGAAPSKVLVFAENLNDAKSIAELLVHENPRLKDRVQTVPRPTSLQRNAGNGAVQNWVKQIGRVIDAQRAQGTSIAAVFVHRDCDGQDPGGSHDATLAEQLASIPAVPVLPTEETEAWWFYFPDAVEAVKPGVWRGRMPRAARNVDTLTSPKEQLMSLTRVGKGAEYSESDSPRVAGNVRSGKSATCGSSPSYQRFAQRARAVS